MVLSLTPGRTYKLHNKDGSVSRIIIGKKLAALMKAGPQMLIERPGTMDRKESRRSRDEYTK